MTPMSFRQVISVMSFFNGGLELSGHGLFLSIPAFILHKRAAEKCEVPGRLCDAARWLGQGAVPQRDQWESSDKIQGTYFSLFT